MSISILKYFLYYINNILRKAIIENLRRLSKKFLLDNTFFTFVQFIVILLVKSGVRCARYASSFKLIRTDRKNNGAQHRDAAGAPCVPSVAKGETLYGKPMPYIVHLSFCSGRALRQLHLQSGFFLF